MFLQTQVAVRKQFRKGWKNRNVPTGNIRVIGVSFDTVASCSKLVLTTSFYRRGHESDLGFLPREPLRQFCVIFLEAGNLQC